MSDKLSQIHRVQIADYHDYQTSSVIFSPSHLTHTVLLHWHDHYEIEYVLSGTGTHILNGVTYPICPGTFHLLTLTDFHELRSDDPLHDPIRIVKASFLESDLPSQLFQSLASLPPNFVLHFDGEEQALFDNFFSLAKKLAERFSGTQENAIISKDLLECILLNIIDHCRKHDLLHTATYADTTDMNRILTYIHRNFRKNLTLKTLAEYSRFSPNYLSRLFHQTMGVTFKEYVTSLRMAFAAKLLVNTQSSITEICFESGFGSLSNFIREFKKIYHVSPSEYRFHQTK